MDATKLAEIQKLFVSLLNSLHECWFMNEQHPGSYSTGFVKLLKKYYKISWEDECDMKMDETYFECLHDSSKPVTKSVYYTHKLHLILCQLTKQDVFGRSYWEGFVFSYSDDMKKRTATSFNRYIALYNELAIKPKKD
jgi:hypothetical protein